jgi:soluble lytic murein transglycosylase
MRVTEAIPAYRARLTGQTGPIAFTALLNGAPPFIRPQARPDRTALAEAGPEPETQTGATPAPAPSLRPVARPEG